MAIVNASVRQARNQADVPATPSNTRGSLSDAQIQVEADIHSRQAAARRDPRLNGQDARDRLRKGGAK
jgi:hypothetical protein